MRTAHDLVVEILDCNELVDKLRNRTMGNNYDADLTMAAELLNKHVLLCKDILKMTPIPTEYIDAEDILPRAKGMLKNF